MHARLYTNLLLNTIKGGVHSLNKHKPHHSILLVILPMLISFFLLSLLSFHGNEGRGGRKKRSTHCMALRMSWCSADIASSNCTQRSGFAPPGRHHSSIADLGGIKSASAGALKPQYFMLDPTRVPSLLHNAYQTFVI